MKLELIALGFIMIFIAAFAYVSSSGNHEWSGADDQAKDTISKLTGDTYKPCFHSVWTPPSSEIESLLFALQAAIGSLIIGYFLGYYRALAKMKTAANSQENDGEVNARSAR